MLPAKAEAWLNAPAVHPGQAAEMMLMLHKIAGGTAAGRSSRAASGRRLPRNAPGASFQIVKRPVSPSLALPYSRTRAAVASSSTSSHSPAAKEYLAQRRVQQRAFRP